MTKPFGKTVHHGRSLTKGLRLTIALWGAAIPAYFLCGLGVPRYPTLAESPFYWPAALAFAVFYAATIAVWLARRPSPRAPGSSSRTGRFLSRFLLASLLAFPAGLISASLYEPALKIANGAGSPGSRVVELALVEKVDAQWVLDSPYWERGFHWTVKDVAALPKDLTAGSLAKMTLRRGLLGARWVESVEYTVLR